MTNQQFSAHGLPCGRVFYIDACDEHLLSGWRWYSAKRKNTVYVIGYRREAGKNREAMLLHRLILNLTKDQEGDHRDGDGLNNRRHNLRPSTHSQNVKNRRMRTNKKPFKGVFFYPRRKKYMAQIAVNKARYFGGYHDTAEAAARAYDALARKHHGEFAHLNFAQEPIA